MEVVEEDDNVAVDLQVAVLGDAFAAHHVCQIVIPLGDAFAHIVGHVVTGHEGAADAVAVEGVGPDQVFHLPHI